MPIASAHVINSESSSACSLRSDRMKTSCTPVPSANINGATINTERKGSMWKCVKSAQLK